MFNEGFKRLRGFKGDLKGVTWLEHRLEPRLESRLELRLEPRLEPRLDPRLEPRLDPGAFNEGLKTLILVWNPGLNPDWNPDWNLVG